MARKTTAPKAPKAQPAPKPEEDDAPMVEGLAGPSAIAPDQSLFPSAPAEEAKTEKVKPDREKIIVTLDANGGLDLNAMRESTREKLRSAINSSADGLFPKAPKSEPTNLPDAAIDAIYLLLGAVETMAASRIVPREVAEQVFHYGPGELAALRKPTNAVIAKHAKKLKFWEEEVTLALVLAQVHFQKIAALRSYQAQAAAAAAAPAPRADAATGQ